MRSFKLCLSIFLAFKAISSFCFRYVSLLTISNPSLFQTILPSNFRFFYVGTQALQAPKDKQNLKAPKFCAQLQALSIYNLQIQLFSLGNFFAKLSVSNNIVWVQNCSQTFLSIQSSEIVRVQTARYSRVLKK